MEFLFCLRVRAQTSCLLAIRGTTAVSALSELRSLNAIGFVDKAMMLKAMSSLPWALGWIARESLPNFLVETYRARRLGLFHPHIAKTWREQAGDDRYSGSTKSYDSLHTALWQDHTENILPALLQYGDAISMAHGIETRLPFMDYRLVEWVFRRSPALMRHGLSKSPIRDYLRARGFLAIAERRDKLGYPVPMLEWYRNIGRELMSELVGDRSAPVWEIFRADEVKRLSWTAPRTAPLRRCSTCTNALRYRFGFVS